MSELKVYHCNEWHNEYTEFYLKSEVNKVIAEKDKEISELQKQVHEYAQGLYEIQARAEKEIRRQKYKRCIYVAKWCFTRCNYFFFVGRIESGRLAKKNVHRSMLYSKWSDLWMTLADKFKEDE